MWFATPGSGLTETLDPLKASVILHELHQTAQPLTVLQGLLELALLSSATAEEYRGVIQRAVEESRRVSSGFDRIRKLVANSSPKNQCVSQTPEPQRIECVHV
jgi:signal transduction histidine kinase